MITVSHSGSSGATPSIVPAVTARQKAEGDAHRARSRHSAAGTSPRTSVRVLVGTKDPGGDTGVADGAGGIEVAQGVDRSEVGVETGHGVRGQRAASRRNRGRDFDLAERAAAETATIARHGRHERGAAVTRRFCPWAAERVGERHRLSLGTGCVHPRSRRPPGYQQARPKDRPTNSHRVPDGTHLSAPLPLRPCRTPALQSRDDLRFVS